MLRILHIANNDDKAGSYKCLCELIQAEKTCGNIEMAVLTPVHTGLNDYCDKNHVKNYSAKFLPSLYTVNSKLSSIKFLIRCVQYHLFQKSY